MASRQAAVPTPVERVPSTFPNPKSAMNTKGTILVVDDTPADLKLLVDTLKAEGYQVLPAVNGELALNSIGTGPPELILLDLHAPGLGGFDVLQRLQARPESRDIPVVFISASGEGAQRVEGLKLGAVDYITKPFQREELLARVQTHLKLRRLQVRLEQQAASLQQANAQFQTDLVERKRAEEKLQQSEARFRAITDSAQDAILMMDPEGRMSYWNPAAERILGYTSAEALGQNLHDLIAPARFHAPHHAAFPTFRQTGQGGAIGKTLDLVARRKDGREISVQLSLSAVQMDGGWHAVGIIRDITERKRLEEALARTSETLLRTGELAKVGGWELDLRTQKVFWTLETCRIHEVEPPVAPPLEQAINFYVPEARPVIQAAVQAAIASGTPFDLDLPLITAKGRSLWIRAQGSALLVEGHVVKLHGAFQDITERKRMEDQLRQLSRAVEQNPASIVITDPAGAIEYVNPKFIEITGYTLAEAVGQNPRILKSGEKSPEAYGELWQTLTAGKEWRGEFHNRKKNGELYWESAAISPIRDASGRITHYVAVKEDITARKQTEAERDQLIQDLQQALTKVKSLSGLLPICAWCKKIRDDQGYWKRVESYVQEHSEATFTHGMCPDCLKKYYPELDETGPENP